MPRPPHIVFAGGSTPGHLHPGLAVASQLIERIPNARITFVGGRRATDRQTIRSAGFGVANVPSRPAPTTALGAVRFVTDNVAGYWAARWFLKENRVSAVVGLGGAASAPAVRAAISRGIPTLMLEQNVVPGRVTRWLARSATTVCAGFQETRGYFPSAVRLVVTGNPARPAFERIYRESRLNPHPSPLPKGEGKRLLPLPPGEGRGEGTSPMHNTPSPCPLPKGEGKRLLPLPPGEGRGEGALFPLALHEDYGDRCANNHPLGAMATARSGHVGTANACPRRPGTRLSRSPGARAGMAPDLERQKRLIIIGGAGGARSLNENMPAALARLREQLGGWQVVHQSGDGQLQETVQRYRAAGVDALVVAFIDELAPVMSASDLVICRPGGTTLAELALASVPAILVPYARVIDDHLPNAEVFARAGAATIIDETDPDEPLVDQLVAQFDALLTSDAERNKMAGNMRRLARPGAAANVANAVHEMLFGAAVRLAA
jgi:UDP-N-acetylglucosamine:LPS N-acetylglucosamine transferase